MAKKRVKWEPVLLVSLFAVLLVSTTAALSSVKFIPVHRLEKITAPKAKAAVPAVSVIPAAPAGGVSLVKTVPEKKNVAEKIIDTVSEPMPVLPVQVGSVFDTAKPVYGVNLGGMAKQREIYGLSVAAMHAYNQKKGGVSVSFLDFCQDNYGLALTLGGGAVNHYGCAVGLWNFSEYNHGVQIGLVNQAYPGAMLASGMDKINGDGNDVKITFADGSKENKSSKEKSFGVQFGLINRSEGRGMQFGLWNINPNAWLPHFPLVNFAF